MVLESLTLQEPQSKKVKSPPSYSKRRPVYLNQTHPLAHSSASSCAVQVVLAAVTQSPQSCCLCGSAVAVVAVAGGAVECSGAVPQCESVWRQTPAS